jgi:hypothetical protein
VAVTAERTTQFSGAVVTAGWCGPGDGDGGGRGQEGGSVVPTMEEERDGAVPGCGSEGRADGAVPGLGDSVEVVGVAAVSKRAREILAA